MFERLTSALAAFGMYLTKESNKAATSDDFKNLPAIQDMVEVEENATMATGYWLGMTSTESTTFTAHTGL